LALRQRGIPGILPPNNYIRKIISLDHWKSLTEGAGFHEADRQAVQWLCCAPSAGLERYLRRHRLLYGIGSNYLVIYCAD
jgi:hypothetical protein